MSFTKLFVSAALIYTLKEPLVPVIAIEDLFAVEPLECNDKDVAALPGSVRNCIRALYPVRFFILPVASVYSTVITFVEPRLIIKL